MKNRIFIGVLLLVATFVGCAQVEESPTIQVDANSPLIVFDESEFDFGIIKQSGGKVSHDFSFTYLGEETRTITSTPASCLCTEGSTTSKVLNKGTKGSLTIEFNPNLHTEPEGRFFKSVAIITDPPLPSSVEATIWVEIDLDLGEEFFELKTPHVDDHEDEYTSNSTQPVAHDGSVPPFKKSTNKEFTVTAKEITSELDTGMQYEYWTYDGTVPGSFMRVKEGDMVTIHFENEASSKNMHSIDLHAVNGPGGGAAVTQVYPGEKKSFQFKALNPGVYVYHCATQNVAEHMANGMYGLIVVEPKQGYEKVDHEYYLMQGEFYPLLKRKEKGPTRLSGAKMLQEQPEYIVFNGKVGALVEDTALHANVGETVRLFVGNGGVAKVSNFHVIGEIFDTVYPEGGTPVQHDIQTTLVPAGGATIVEFVVDAPGTYKIVDHALARLQKGAIAELIVTGDSNPEVFTALPDSQ